MKAPENCTSMAELRGLIDQIDRRLIDDFALRQRCIDRAIQLKPAEGLPARIPSRVEEVIAKVRASADNAGLEPDLAEALWRHLIDWAIAREEKVLGNS